MVFVGAFVCVWTKSMVIFGACVLSEEMNLNVRLVSVCVCVCVRLLNVKVSLNVRLVSVCVFVCVRHPVRQFVCMSVCWFVFSSCHVCLVCV